MRHPALAPLLALALAALVAGLAGPAAAACFADYKAKRDGPLELHYGTIEIPDSACSVGAAAPVVASRIGADGWQLLSVVSVFGPEGLAQRERDAGAYHLRY